MQTDQSIQTNHVVGSALLVAGCCIGAGMLGLPVLSAAAGFIPSVLMFLIVWAFMACSGLLLLEVTLWFSEEVNIVTMAHKILGLAGKIISGFAFLFLFYCLMVAYVAGSGSLFSSFMQHFFSIEIPNGVGSLLVTVIFGSLIFLGTGMVDRVNRFLMAGLIISYALLITLGLAHVNHTLLLRRNWEASLYVIPVMIISFGFHNLIPSLTTYLKRNIKALRQAIVIGSAIPLLVYLIWEFVILGIVASTEGFQEALDKGDMATQALQSAVGSSFILESAQYFAFFAIITSFLAVSLSFVDFLSDGLGIKKTVKGKIILCCLALLPPFICSLQYPHVFLKALNYAGGFGAVILYGIFPALMVWVGRYKRNIQSKEIVWGGKPVLILMILFATSVMIIQLI